MSYRNSLVLIPALSFVLCVSAIADIHSTAQVSENALAVAYTLPNAVVWEPQITYISVTLSVSTPNGEITFQTFSNGDEPLYAPDSPIDGVYTYELRFRTVADQGERDDSGKDGLGPQPTPLTFSGGFSVMSGEILVQDPAPATDSDGGLGPRDEVIPDDLIVRGSACVGFDCVDGEDFGFDIIKLKENVLRIKFEDTSTGSFPQNDWQILVNDSEYGGLDRFSIEDVSGGNIPFTIEAGAPANALYVESDGDIGVGTSSPAVRMQLEKGNTPALRLEQNGSLGFAPQSWDLGGNEVNFFVRDVTNSFKLPFRIRPAAPTSSIDVAADGDVGLGTGSPSARLHVYTTNALHTDLARFENASTTPDPSVNIKLVSGTNEWTIGVDGTDNKMILSSADEGLFSIDPKTRLVVAEYGFTSGGIIHHASDRNKKDSFKEIEVSDVLNKVLQLPINQWKFKTESKDVRHMGPTSQDFMSAFGLGTDEKFIDTVDADGVALAAIQGLNLKLTQELAEKQAEIDSLKKEFTEQFASLELRLVAMEASMN